MEKNTIITIETTVNAPIETVWESFSKPEHITKWNTAHPDWHSPRAQNDLRTGGKFNIRMEAKDGSMGFDFAGIYDEVIDHKLIKYTMGDNREVQVQFLPGEDGVRIVESFEAEKTNSEEMQREGWQAILDSFKVYTEKMSGE